MLTGLPLTGSFALALLPVFLPLLLPLIALLLPLLFTGSFTGNSLRITLLLLGAFLTLGDLPLLARDELFHLLELVVLLVPFGALRGGLDGIIHVRLGALEALRLGGLGAYIGGAQLADLLLDGAGRNELLENRLGALIDTCAIEGAIDERDGLAAFEGQELIGIAFDFCFGDFEDSSEDLVAGFLM